MANKCIKRYSTSYNKGSEKQKNEEETFHVIRSGKKLKCLTISGIDENKEKLEGFCAPGVNENCQPNLNCNLSIFSKVKSNL